MRYIPMPRLLLKDMIRFWGYIDRVGKSEDECWFWIGSKQGKGYGNFSIRGQNYLATRLAYYIHFKVDPKELLVCHTCNTPICCNYNHFYLGTNRENIQQACDDGLKPMIGSLSSRAIFHESTILLIRAEFEHGKTTAQLAREYNCSYSAMRAIIKRENWSHVY